MAGLDSRTLDPMIRHACEQVVRLRLRDIESEAVGDAKRRTAKRASLDLLHFAVKEGEVDGLQIHVLLELLEARAHELDSLPLPFWPGAQYPFLVEVMEEKFAIEKACQALHDALDAEHARRERDYARQHPRWRK